MEKRMLLWKPRTWPGPLTPWTRPQQKWWNLLASNPASGLGQGLRHCRPTSISLNGWNVPRSKKEGSCVSRLQERPWKNHIHYRISEEEPQQDTHLVSLIHLVFQEGTLTETLQPGKTCQIRSIELPWYSHVAMLPPADNFGNRFGSVMVKPRFRKQSRLRYKPHLIRFAMRTYQGISQW